MKHKIEIEINNIKVGSGFYSFEYIAKIDDNEIKEFYRDTHILGGYNLLKKELKNGYALRLILLQLGTHDRANLDE